VKRASASKKKKAPFGKFVLAGLAAVLLAGLAVEGAFRVFVPMDVLVYRDSLNPALRFELKPNSRGIKNNVLVEINDQGIRDRHVPDNKEPGEFRILTVGDHSTFGVGVPLEDSYVKKLTDFIKAPSYLRPTTINLSMYHYALHQKLELLRLRGPAFQPDFVVLQMTGADNKAIPPSKYPWPKLKNFLRDKSRFARWVMENAYWKRPEPRPDPNAPRQAPTSENPLADSLEGAKLLTQQAGLPLLVVYVPDISLKNPEKIQIERNFAESLAAACKQTGLDYYDVSNAFRFHDPQSLLLHQDQPWLNAKGHRILAEALATELNRHLRKVPLLREKPAR
jgi:lysophospholipase L1-like esterase